MRKQLLLLLFAAIALAASAAAPRMSALQAAELVKEGKAIKVSAKLHRRTAVAVSDARFHKAAPARVSTARQSAMAKVRENAPARVTARGANLYGYIYFNNILMQDEEAEVVGLYEFQGNELDNVWYDPLYAEEFMYLASGWLRNGHICGYAPAYWGSYLIGLYYYECDFETGEIIEGSDAEMENLDNGYFSVCAYNEDDDTVYGFGINGEGENYIFARTPASNPDGLEVIKTIDIDSEEEETCPYICYNPVEKSLYGINYAGMLVRIGLDGSIEELLDVSSMGEIKYQGTMAYSNAARGYYVNHTTEETSELFFIDLKAGEVTKVMDMPDESTFSIMVCTDPTRSPEAPEAPVVKSTEFADGANDGVITIELPSKNIGGTDLSGELSWTATVDRAVYKTGKAAPGAVVPVEFTELSNDMHAFTFFTTANGVEGLSANARFYVGNDTPLAPEYVIFEDGAATWPAVEGGVHGGYLDLSKIEYNVYLNGTKVGTTAETTLPVTLPTDADLAVYVVSVEATCNGMTSAQTGSDKVISGKPFTPDVAFAPTAEQAGLFTISDDNYDEQTWEFYPEFRGHTAFISNFSADGPSDDWLYFPAIDFASNARKYRLTFDVDRMGSTIDGEYYEVFIGNAAKASAMTQQLIEKTEVAFANGEEQKGDVYFRVPEAGTYYIGIHCVSDYNRYGVVVNNISVTDPGISNASPQAVTDIAAVAAEKGELKAKVTFTLPSKTVGGEEIPATTTVSATVKAAESAVVTGKPGETVSADVVTVQGSNTVSVIASIDGNNSPEATVKVYTGVDNPGMVRNLVVTPSDDMLSAVMTWEAPDEGANGGYIVPENITYEIWTDNGYGFEPYESLGKNVFTYTYSIPAGSAQDFYKLAVVTSNEAGLADYMNSDAVVLGTPYELPVSEDFEEGENEPLAINPWAINYPSAEYNNQKWNFVSMAEIFSDDSYTTNGIMGYQTSLGNAGMVCMSMPRFTTKDVRSAAVKVVFWGGNKGVVPFVTATAAGVPESVEVPATVAEADNQWNTLTATLPESLLGKGWVQINFNGKVTNSNPYVIIEEVAVNGESAGVGAVEASSKSIEGAEGAVIVRGYAGETVAVYTVDGRTLASVNIASDSEAIAAPAAIYVVKAGDTVRKVVVK